MEELLVKGLHVFKAFQNYCQIVLQGPVPVYILPGA